MKKRMLAVLAFMLFLSTPSFADPVVGINGSGAVKFGDASALACDATTEGSLRYDAGGDLWQYCDGAAWRDLASGSGSDLFEDASGVIRSTSGVVDYTTADFVFGSPQLADDGNAAHYSRMFFDKSKSALRAGYVTSTQWDDANIGDYSTAWGSETTASGLRSTAWGSETTASNSDSTAWGESTTASGDDSTAWGVNTTASGDDSTAWGNGTHAGSYAETSFGQYSLDTAGNWISWVDTDTLFEIGNGTGAGSRANALTILKNGNVGIGTASPATGGEQDLELHVQGDIGAINYCDEAGNNCFTAVSVGTANAHGMDGNIQFNSAGGLWSDNNFVFTSAGRLGVGTSAPSEKAHLAGGNFLATGTYGAGDTLGVSGAGTRMFFYPRKAAFRAGFVSGTQWDDASIGSASTAWGSSARASGSNSAAWGQNTTASSLGSTAWGQNTTASGSNSTAFGFSTLASGDLSTAWGELSAADGMDSTAAGFGTHAGSYAETSFGRYSLDTAGNLTSWVDTDTLFEIGNGSGAFARANAVTVLKNGNVGIGTASPSLGDVQLMLDVEGNIGAINYCDEAGNNCFTATDVGGGASVFEDASGVIRATSGLVDYTTADFVFGSPQLADDGNPNHDARMFFDKSKSAFRAGGADGPQWNEASVGDNSAAFGWVTTASGLRSFAAGGWTAATGINSAAFGWNSVASGDNSFAAGNGTASGEFSMSWGDSTTAGGIGATAWGQNSSAGGNYSTAFGNSTASGVRSTSFGFNTEASGINSLAVGANSVASGAVSKSMAFNGEASGMYSIAMGVEVVAGSGTAGDGTGDSSIAVGLQTDFKNFAPVITGDRSMVLFFDGGTDGVNESYDFADSDKFALIGGEFQIDDVGASANKGCIRYNSGTTKLEYSHDCSSYAELGSAGGLWTDNTSHISYQNAHIIKTGQALPAGFDADGTRMFFYPDKAAFRGGAISSANDAWQDVNIGANSFAFGENAQASGDQSTAMGSWTTASGDQSTALGGGTTASGFGSTVMGSSTTAGGDFSTAMGDNTTASGITSTAMGDNTTASGDWSTAMGSWTTASGDQSTALGGGTAASGFASISMGNGTIASGAYSMAMGREAMAGSGTAGDGAGDHAFAIGLQSGGQATDPKITGDRTMALFMDGGVADANSGYDITANDLFAIIGGRALIDPTRTKTDTATGGEQDLELHVQGDIGALNYCDEAGNNCFTAASVAGGGTPAGNSGEIQFNSGGAFGASGNLFWDSANGRLGIGTGGPSQRLSVYGLATINKNSSDTSTGGSSVALQINNQGGNSDPGNPAIGVDAILSPSVVTVTNDFYGFKSWMFKGGTGTVANYYAYYAQTPTVFSGSVTNAYGLYLENVAGATANNYAIYSAGGQSYFAGNVGIGTTSPDAILTIAGDGEDIHHYSYSNGPGSKPDIYFRRARGTEASPLVVQDGDLTGGVGARAWDGNSWAWGAAIEMGIDGTPGDGDMPSYMKFMTAPDGSETLATRMIIKNDGNVGLNETSPLTPLHIVKESYSTPSSALGLNTVLTVQGVDGGIETVFDSSAGGGSWGSYIGFTGVSGGALVDKWGIRRQTSSPGSGDSALYFTFGTDRDIDVNPTIMKMEASGDIVMAGTGALTVPSGTGAQQPGTPANGMIRYNTDNDKFEGYQAGSWQDVITAGGTPAGADGHIQFNSGGSFASDANFVFTSAGYLGLGKSSPGVILDVDGTGSAISLSGYITDYSNIDYGGLYIGEDNSNKGFIVWRTALDRIEIGTESLGFPIYVDGSVIALQSQGGGGAVGIGDTTPDTGTGGQLLLDVEGNVGAINYCDEAGNNCFTAAGVGGGSSVFEDASGVIRATSGLVDYSTADFVFGSPQLADDGNASHDSRMFFDKSKSAFRAGWVGGTQWDDANVGQYSVALGVGTTASGLMSTAMGAATIASGAQSTAMGSGTTAAGAYSMAVGFETNASGVASMAMGFDAHAGSFLETSFGQYSLATAGNLTSWVDTDTLFEIGNGANAGARANALTVLKNGFVGIGTATPTQAGNMLEVRADSASDYTRIAVNNADATRGATFAMFQGADRNAVMFYENGTDRLHIANENDSSGGVGGDIYFGTDGGPFSGNIVFSSAGYVGIGTTSPDVALDVAGDIEYTGTITDVSDIRLKKDITRLDTRDVVARLSQIDTYSFRMIDDPKGTLELGVIAQEVEKVFPELVRTADDEMGTKSVNYVGFIAPLIEASKDLKAENEALKAELANLKATQDLNGLAKLKLNGAAPATCDAMRHGSVALTSAATMCVCNTANSWVEVNTSNACPW